MVTRAALIWITLGIGMTCAMTPAMAQTYDPNYPVCLQVYAHDRLHRLQLYLDCPVQCDGFGPRSTMFRQSIFHTTRAGGAAGSVNVMPTGTT